MYIKYLNYPQVPNELLESVDAIIAKAPEEMFVKKHEVYFRYRPVEHNLQEWLESVFKFKFYAKYQVISPGIPIHTDKPAFKGDRRIAFNYLLDQGGSNVITSVYDKDMNILQSELLPLKTWHSIKVEMLHGVEGIETLRVALTITPLF